MLRADVSRADLATRPCVPRVRTVPTCRQPAPVYPPKRVISGDPCPVLRAISSRAMSAVVEMPWTFSLNSSTFEAQRSASSSVTKPC